MGGADPEHVIQARLEEMGLEMEVREVPVEHKVRDYERHEVLIPVRDNRWEDYHSSVVPGRRVLTPAKEIAEHLDLCGQPQTFDLFEKNGQRASVAFQYGEPWHTFQKLTYLRQDLLERFLTETHTEFIWAIWGERQYYSRDAESVRAFAEDHESHRVFQHIVQYSVFRFEC